MDFQCHDGKSPSAPPPLALPPVHGGPQSLTNCKMVGNDTPFLAGFSERRGGQPAIASCMLVRQVGYGSAPCLQSSADLNCRQPGGQTRGPSTNTKRPSRPAEAGAPEPPGSWARARARRTLLACSPPSRGHEQLIHDHQPVRRCWCADPDRHVRSAQHPTAQATTTTAVFLAHGSGAPSTDSTPSFVVSIHLRHRHPPPAPISTFLLVRPSSIPAPG